MGNKSDDYREQNLELTYKIKVRTFGKMSKEVDDIGQSLADKLGLQFKNVEVSRGKRTYRRKANEPWDAEKDGSSVCVDKRL